MKKRVLGFDLGASSGRAMLGVWEDGRLECRELHRFENRPVERDGHLCWDFPALLGQVRRALSAAGAVDSVAFDTWGVDFGLLDGAGKLLGLPVHYRDRRTEGYPQRALGQMSQEELYRRTGCQIMPINTLFQLLALREEQPELLERAERLLFMPELFVWALGGRVVNELSAASTSQLLDPNQRRWSQPTLDAFGIPRQLFSGPGRAGATLGNLGRTKLVAAAGHDTQCAVAAMPVQPGQRAAFLSCGTWSLLGCELDAPICTRESMLLGMSNEVGADGKINYLKNIVGLWLLQESRRQWQREGQEYSFAELCQLARSAPALVSLIDPDDPVFSPPGDIPGRIAQYCRRTGQPVPETVGAVARCIFESLALKYRLTLEQLRQLTGREFTILHILGGGSRNELLCRMTADCCGIRVLAGPVEATALGNIILQLQALDVLPSLEEGRVLTAGVEALRTYEPEDTAPWDAAYPRFLQLLKEALNNSASAEQRIF